MLIKHLLKASFSSPVHHHQGGGVSEESATVEGADSSGKPFGTGGQFYF